MHIGLDIGTSAIKAYACEQQVRAPHLSQYCAQRLAPASRLVRTSPARLAKRGG